MLPASLTCDQESVKADGNDIAETAPPADSAPTIPAAIHPAQANPQTLFLPTLQAVVLPWLLLFLLLLTESGPLNALLMLISHPYL